MANYELLYKIPGEDVTEIESAPASCCLYTRGRAASFRCR